MTKVAPRDTLDEILLNFAYKQTPEGMSDQELITKAKQRIQAYITKQVEEAVIAELQLALTEQYMPDCNQFSREMVIDAEYIRDRIKFRKAK